MHTEKYDLSSSGSNCTKWADDQHTSSRARAETGAQLLHLNPPLQKDLVPNPVWCEAETSKLSVRAWDWLKREIYRCLYHVTGSKLKTYFYAWQSQNARKYFEVPARDYIVQSGSRNYLIYFDALLFWFWEQVSLGSYFSWIFRSMCLSPAIKKI